MSKYTTELRFICENYAGYDESTGLSNIDDVLDKSRSKVFDFDFPIFDESYRNVLENKIIMHYYTREIASETVGLWKFWLRTKMNEIMPYYNQLYASTVLEFNPFYDIDMTTDYQKVDNGQHSNTGTLNENSSENGRNNGSNSNTRSNTVTNIDGNKNDHWEYFSETPEGGINGVANLNYLTTALHTTDDRTGSTSGSTGSESNVGSNETVYENSGTIARNTSDSGTIKNIEDYLHHVKGKSGGASYSKLLEEYRKTFLNIDMMIIGELKNLFIQLW